VIARDQRCIWNGCETPASRCEIHHLRWWSRDHGPTSIANAGAVCRHHHTQIHQLHLSVERIALPPGWIRSRTAAGEPVDAATPGTHGQPLRYVFRDPTGTTINAPDSAENTGTGAAGTASTRPPAATSTTSARGTRPQTGGRGRRADQPISEPLWWAPSPGPPPDWATG